MRKVLVVDDEKWVRKGLIQSIPWERLGLELVGEAADGREGYESALRIKPDILFLDMRMPGVDGRELIGMLNRDLPGTITIVISGYSDFEYTKEAIRNRAFEYLLKPVKKEELAAVLEKALAELGQRESRESKAASGLREEWLRRRLFRSEESGTEEERQSDEASGLPAWWKTGECLVIAGLADSYRDASNRVALMNAVRHKLAKEMPFLFEGRWDGIVTDGPDDSGEAVLALAAERIDPAGLQRLGVMLQHAARQLPGSPSFSFGVSRRARAGELAAAYREAHLALKRKKLGVSGAFLETSEGAPQPSAAYPSEAEKTFLLALQMGNPETVRKEFDRLFGIISAPDRTVNYMQRSAVLLVHSIEKQLQAEDSQLEEIAGQFPSAYADRIGRRNDPDSVKELFADELLPALLAYYNRTGEKQGEQIVREVEKLIDTHYNQPLSMLMIAGMHYMNPDYLSRLFKKTTGRNFVDYLTDVRIDKAKQLMKLDKYKNYEIAQAVGYEDYRYFSQIFKKKTGMTIGEYRETAADSGDRKER